MRIVSLIASATDIVCALGAGSSLVGRSHECDHPQVAGLPALTAPKFNTAAASRLIDRAVKDLVREGLSVYSVDEEALREAAPDLIITQDQCEVCAASLKQVEEAVCAWVGPKTEIISLRPNCLADIVRDIGRIGDALGARDRASALIAETEQRLAAAANPTTPRPRVLCVEWIDPLMTAGHWIPEVIEFGGGVPLLARAGGPSPAVSVSDVAAADPDLIIVAPCGFDVERSAAEMNPLDHAPEWRRLRAVRDGRVALADGNRLFNRPSPAVAESAEVVAEIIGVLTGANPARRFGEDVWVRWN